MKLIPGMVTFTALAILSATPVLSAQVPKDESSHGLPAYRYTSLTFGQRAADLVSKMTLREKISQMESDAPAIPRLGIPAYNWGNECLHGLIGKEYSTVFPQVIGMAATFDPRLIHHEAECISTEARAQFNFARSGGLDAGIPGLNFFAPNINIARDPRWGRDQETYGEDPYLTSTMAVAFVTGLQGDNAEYLKVISTPKHFDAHSGPELGRHRFSAEVGKRDLFDTYLPAFEAAVRQGGAFSVMAAYTALNGVPDCANHYLLTDFLRKRWGFKGYVVSDCGAIWYIYRGHDYAPSMSAAAADAVKAGCDLNCYGNQYSVLGKAFEDGLISEAAIDTAVTRLMLARMKLGLFDPPSVVPYDTITIADNNTPAHRMLARKVADESIVLLKNAHRLLPLSKHLKSVAVIGAYADDANVLLGNYHGTPSSVVTILQGIKDELGQGTTVRYAAGYNPLDDKMVRPVVIDPQYLDPGRTPGERGLFGEYYDNPHFRGKPVVAQVDSVLDPYFGWGFVPPVKGVPAMNFSVRWTGTITPPETGDYELGITDNEGGKLYFEGRLLVNDLKPDRLNVFKSKLVHLEKGRKYSVKIEYADSGRFAGIRFEWYMPKKLKGRQSLIREAMKAARESDVVIAVAGISANLESEENSNLRLPGFIGGDRTRLGLPAGEEALLKALHRTGKPIVLVLVGGSALAVDWAQENVPAIVDAWYPGEEGGNAVADVLFGDYNPAGRLPVTFYKSVKQLPPFTDYSMRGRTYRYFTGRPLYPFGYGLSYTSFGYSDLLVNKDIAGPTDTLRVSVNIGNTGGRDGDEVAQLYVKSLTSEPDKPLKSLKGFERVDIPRGESRTVTFVLPVSSLQDYSVRRNGYVVRPGKYELEVGSSSADIHLRRIVKIRE